MDQSARNESILDGNISGTLFLLSFITAGVLHVAAFLLVGLFVVASEPAEAYGRFDLVEIETPEPMTEEPPEPETEEPTEVPEPSAPVTTKKQLTKPTTDQPVAKTEAPPQNDEPISFGSNFTVGAGASSWSVQGGSAGGSKKVKDNPNGSSTAANGVESVPIKSLARAPKPPGSLGRQLERAFPKAARNRHIEGEAVVAIRIKPDGGVIPLRTISESPKGEGFASACKRVLAASKWSPPLNKQGRPVNTSTSFECAFLLQR